MTPTSNLVLKMSILFQRLTGNLGRRDKGEKARKRISVFITVVPKVEKGVLTPKAKSR